MGAKTSARKLAWLAVFLALFTGKVPPESRLAWLSSVGMDIPRNVEPVEDDWRGEMMACRS